MHVLALCRVNALRLIGLGAFVLLAPTDALADLKICNQSDGDAQVAVGYKTDTGWISQGWSKIGPFSCATVIEGPLTSRYFYVHAVNWEDGFPVDGWSGKVSMCIGALNEAFKIDGVRDCEGRGHKKAGFLEVDTRNQEDWILTLKEE